MTIGIYAIVNRNAGKVYLGKSKHIEIRWQQHLSDLRLNKHHNKELQADWWLLGQDTFDFNIVQECTESEVDLVEREIIAHYRDKSLYNYDKSKHPWGYGNHFNNLSGRKWVKDCDGDILPLKHCPNCNLDKLANSFFNSIYCYECMTNIEAELLEEIETIESISILTGISSAPEGKPVSKYKLSSD